MSDLQSESREQKRNRLEREIKDARFVFLANLQEPGKTLLELRESVSIPDDRFLRFLLDMEERNMIRVIRCGSFSKSVWILTDEGEKMLREHVKI